MNINQRFKILTLNDPLRTSFFSSNASEMYQIEGNKVTEHLEKCGLNDMDKQRKEAFQLLRDRIMNTFLSLLNF